MEYPCWLCENGDLEMPTTAGALLELVVETEGRDPMDNDTYYFVRFCKEHREFVKNIPKEGDKTWQEN